ncbi:unnamed protein product [Macrosiphum euphorbiae]|uniref:Uncharacterized protein n=1 Tax=Macrosiphum euphorbiae TaxID=13131 RepID=A0AAV0VL77_9HEMI|nr:unnamed protein product [Macrosiphum euphorbiae]
MQRVLAYCFRFTHRNIPKSSGPITRMEYERALNAAILCTQMTYLSDLHKQIQNQGSITPTTIVQLAPFIDSNGIIRVGGRLKCALLDENAKYPILLPSLWSSSCLFQFQSASYSNWCMHVPKPFKRLSFLENLLLKKLFPLTVLHGG